MAKERSPHFPFYPKDFLSDEHVQVMTMTERGIYISLLCLCWTEGSIPDDPLRAAKICGSTLKEMKTSWRAIRDRFLPDLEDSSRLRHKRLDLERSKQEAWRLKSSVGGKNKARVVEAVPLLNGLSEQLEPEGEHDASSSPLEAARKTTANCQLPTENSEEVKPPNEEKPSTRPREENSPVPFFMPLASHLGATETTDPVEIVDLCAVVYAAGGVPVPPKHKQNCIQLILNIDPPERRRRVLRYVTWAFTSGKWNSPGKTKVLQNLLNDGDWDVDLTPRILPAAPEPARETDRQRSMRVAKENFRRANEANASGH